MKPPKTIESANAHETFWFVDRLQEEDSAYSISFPDRDQWGVFLQSYGCVFPVDQSWFSKEDAESFIMNEIVGAGVELD